MDEKQDDQEDGGSESFLVFRSTDVLMELPLEFQWEVTRRHPYYLRFWELAHRHYQNAHNGADPREEAAVMILRGIGVATDPVSPDSELDELETGPVSKAWKNGAVAPAMFRTLVSVLFLGLPADGRRQVGQFLLESSE